MTRARALLRRLRTRVTARGEDGFTLIEMITAFTLTAVVIAPVAVAFSEAWNIIPSSSTRAASALQRSVLADKFADDVAQATSVTAASGGPVTCQAAGSDPSTIATIAWAWAPKTIVYKLTWAASNAGLTAVSVVRDDGTPSTLWTGYCSPSSTTNVAEPSTPTDPGETQHQRLDLKLTVRDTPGDADVSMWLGGAVRTTS